MGIKDLFASGAKATIASITDGAANIISKFKADPTKVLEYEKDLETLRVNAEVKIEEIAVQMEAEYTKQQDIVNQTMREEAKSEHFLQWSWRPMIGYLFIIMCFNNYVVLPYLHKYGMLPIELPGEMITAIMIILGVASAGRSAKQANVFKKR